MKARIRSKDGHRIVNLNRRTAIRERCLNCTGWFHKVVNNCSFKDCQLHPFRTGKEKQNSKERLKAIRKYCICCMNGQVREVAKCTSPDCPLFFYRKGDLDRLKKPPYFEKIAHIDAVSRSNRQDALKPMSFLFSR